MSLYSFQEEVFLGQMTLRNTGPDDAPDGFAFAAKLGYYRGLGLSMIEELAVTIDGVEVAARGGALRRRQRAVDAGRNGHGVRSALAVRCASDDPRRLPGGFPSGEHTLSLREKLRVSYLPFPAFNTDTKTVCW